MINLAAAATWVIHPAGGRPRQQQNAELFSERGEPVELETKVRGDFTITDKASTMAFPINNLLRHSAKLAPKHLGPLKRPAYAVYAA